MIALVLAALRARPGRALALLLLTVAAVAAAVAGPVFLAAADRSTIADEVAHATPFELTLQARDTIDLWQERSRTFEKVGPQLVSGPGLTPVFSAEFGAYLDGPTGGGGTRLTFREGVCAHLRMVEGRCPAGTGEVVLSRATAARFGIHNGQPVVEHESVVTRDGPAPTGPPATLAVVGIFEIGDPSDRYWADQHYFDPTQGGDDAFRVGEPVFTSRGTVEALRHHNELQKVDALLDPATLTPARLAAVRATMSAVRARAEQSPIPIGSGQNQIQLGTGLPDLLDRIDADRAGVREVVPLAAIPLVVLAWMVLLLAAGAATDARRGEVALLKLRGTGRAGRWWLVLGESALAVLVGAPLGYLVGYAVVAATARLLLPGAGPVTLSGHALGWAAIGVLGAVGVTLLAQRRPFAAPVAELLRQVPSRGGGWRGQALEAVLYPLAVAAVVQLRANPGPLTGVALFAPGLVVLAVALLAARLAGPVIGAIGRRAMRRGRLGVALGALRLARRAGAARLLALLVIAVAQLCFAVTAAGVAQRATADRAAVELGAARVLTVLPLPRTDLLRAVRTADPTGRYAMAAATVPAVNDGDPPTLAVDATRLARVTTWLPEFGPLTAAQAADRLRPKGGFDPILVRGPSIGVEATATDVPAERQPHLVVHLAPVAGGPSQPADLGVLVPGRHRYSASIADCPGGCRLVGIEVALSASTDVDLVLHGLYQGDPATPIDAGLVQPGRWRAPAPGAATTVPTLTPGPDGLAVSLRLGGLKADPWIMPTYGVYPLPVVTAGPLTGDVLGGPDATPQRVRTAGTLAVLPQLGRRGVLVDLEYAERTARDSGTAVEPQVLLAADAPDGLVDKLRQAGLTVVGSKTDADRVRYLQRQGPATGLRFHLLAGALAILLALGGLALVATVDRRTGGQLRALWVQGVPRPTLAAANRYGYTGLVLAALLLGPLAAGAAWLLTGRSIPLFADRAQTVPLPGWPAWPLLAAGWAAAGLVLLGSALVAARISAAELDDGGRD
ncbi:ABC transporter permease [Planosporangium thailandense]|uniref:ABC transporter permease n=1 Tax=Planosporangium thailandense TaxID=765197 RepID=A0ABX0Y1Q3_9ACTN|nr:ABC transporter permease [Planosporangium thailandense]NJC72067.1 ABC transporter permease [Planosporangium thailandense]